MVGEVSGSAEGSRDGIDSDQVGAFFLSLCLHLINMTHWSSGPCGVPQEDQKNGYRRYDKSSSDLNKPIDRVLMMEDFDFDSNLALFDKKVEGCSPAPSHRQEGGG